MACVNCGSAPCRCSSNCECATPLTQDPAFCCNPNQLNQGCQNTIVAAPQPFYNCAPACPQDHTQRIVLQQFFSTISVSDSWNVPACNNSAVLNVAGLKGAIPGSFIYNASYGYFEITAFNSGTGQITVLNTCITGNAAAGTNIPACTEFIVTDPPCDCNSQTGPCVAVDFTAPAVGNCIDITLTNTTGIEIGFLVEIGTGQYRVSALKPNDIITICNDGAGITPGTPVIAKNAQGQFQYCLQIIAVNPCEAATVYEGNVLVCSTDTPHPITGSAEGHVLTLIDSSLEKAAYRPLGQFNGCARTTAVLHIVAGVNHYTIQVDNSTPFNYVSGPLNLVTIDNRGPTLGEVGLVGVPPPDSTHINVTLFPTPLSNATIPVNTLICLTDCCQSINQRLATLTGESIISSQVGPQTVNTGAPLLTTGVLTGTIINQSLNSASVALVFLQALYSGEPTTAHSQKCYLTFDESFSEDLNPVVPDTFFQRQYYLFDDTGVQVGEFLSRQMFVVLPANTVKQINTEFKINWIAGNASYANARISASMSWTTIPNG